MDINEDYDVGCQPGYFVQSFKNQFYVVPNVFEGQERLPLTSVLQPDLREAMEMPPGVSGTFPDVILTLIHSLCSSKPARLNLLFQFPLIPIPTPSDSAFLYSLPAIGRISFQPGYLGRQLRQAMYTHVWIQ